MTPDDPRHGKRSGYDVHRRAGEDACDACLRAAARYEQERQLDLMRGQPRLIDATGTRRRIHALIRLGHTQVGIARHLGVEHDAVRKWSMQAKVNRTTAHRVATAYETLSMTLPPQATHSERITANRARNFATRNGWAPPLAWDDIDDPRERPKFGSARGRSRTEVDPIVVERLLSGDRIHNATPAEKDEAMRRWKSWGRSAGSLAAMHGWAKPERDRKAVA